MQEYLIPVLIATAGGIIVSGVLIVLGSWLRRVLDLPNDPPPELAEQPAPPTAEIGSPEERRKLTAARFRCGEIKNQIMLWQLTIDDALAAIPHLPAAHCAATAAGSATALERRLSAALTIVKESDEKITTSISDFDATPVTDSNWSTHQQRAQQLLADAEQIFATAQAADADAEAAWQGMPEPSRARLWWLAVALVLVLALAAVVFSQRPLTTAQ